MPTFFADGDIAVMLADIGRPVVIAGHTIKGLIDIVSRDVLLSMGIAGISATVTSVTVQTSSLPSGTHNTEAITVDGISLKIRDMQQTGDGALTHILCEVP